MTDELILMLAKFIAGTGKTPTNIVCGEAAFEKLRQEATDDWGADRYLEPNVIRDGYVARFMGIPIEVIYDTNVMEADRVYVFNKPYEDYHVQVKGAQWWGRRFYWDLIAGDIVDEIGRNPNYGEWLYSMSMRPHPVDEEIDISDADLMAVLNGGGFNAVT